MVSGPDWIKKVLKESTWLHRFPRSPSPVTEGAILLSPSPFITANKQVGPVNSGFPWIEDSFQPYVCLSRFLSPRLGY